MKLVLGREVVNEATSLLAVMLAEHCSGAASCYGYRVDNKVVGLLVNVMSPACSYTRGRSSWPYAKVSASANRQSASFSR